MEAEQPLEELWVALEEMKDAVAEARRTVHEHQGPCHDAGETAEANVGLLVAAEIACVSASPRARAWRKQRPRPSPVIASTEPEASPTSATLPRVTRWSLRLKVTDPRGLPMGRAE